MDEGIYKPSGLLVTKPSGLVNPHALPYLQVKTNQDLRNIFLLGEGQEVNKEAVYLDLLSNLILSGDWISDCIAGDVDTDDNI